MFKVFFPFDDRIEEVRALTGDPSWKVEGGHWEVATPVSGV